jgi:hypothetical protein
MIRASMTWSAATCRFSLHGATSLRRAIIGDFLGFRDKLTGYEVKSGKSSTTEMPHW